jgi:hypothetical protein
VSYLDNSGLGTLVGLKASAMRQGFCILELMRITDLMQLFSS